MENHKQLIELQDQITLLKMHLNDISQMLSESNKQIGDIHKALFNNVAITREERKEQMKEYMKARLIMGNVVKQTKRK